MSARSRLNAGLKWLIETDSLNDQESALAWVLGKAVDACVVHKIPLTIMRFPELIEDEQYCYNRLNPIFKIDRKKFSKVFKELANPKQIKTRP